MFMRNIVHLVDDSYKLMTGFPKGHFDALILDPDYDDRQLDLDLLKHICSGNIIVFCKPENQPFKADQYMFWKKPESTKNFGLSTGRYVEMILVIRQGTVFNKLHWGQMSGFYTDTLIEAPIHPHEKPETLIDRMLRMLTRPGALVGDFFAGSGTSLVSCARLGRQSIGFEREKRYVDMANLRMAGASHDQLRPLGFPKKEL